MFKHLVEGKQHDAKWGKKEPGGCGHCDTQKNKTRCGQRMCVMNPLDNKAYTFDNVCQFMEQHWDKRESVTLHIGLGGCKNLLDSEGKYSF